MLLALAVVLVSMMLVECRNHQHHKRNGLLKTCGSSGAPVPPRVPDDFVARGEWVTPSLNITVPFLWQANRGNMQMSAGVEGSETRFDNYIYNDRLYSWTRAWPGPFDSQCIDAGNYTLSQLNDALSKMHYVGPEVLLGQTNRYVHHWRGAIPTAECGPGKYFRLTLIEADIYTDQKTGAIWKMLHNGPHNLYAPDLDEWAVLESWSFENDDAVILPPMCTVPPTETLWSLMLQLLGSIFPPSANETDACCTVDVDPIIGNPFLNCSN